MDPLTALGLAASIIQFVEFSTRLVSKGGYLNNENKDGALVDQKVLEQLGIQLRRFETELGGIPGTARSRDDEQLARLSEECLAVGKDLTTVLEKLRVSKVGKGWGSTRQALRMIWSKEKLESLQKRLSSIRDEMQLSMLVSMRTNMERQMLSTSERFQHLEESTQTVMKALTSNQGVADVKEPSQMQDFQDRIVAIAQVDRDESNQRQTLAMPGIQSNLATRLEVESGLLKFLSFPVMADRYKSIEKAYSETFDWIFQGGNSQFPDWLSHRSGIFWITGKTASGKSTMMKHIFQSPLTQELLRPWAKSEVFASAAFFFWNSGSALERSQKGLLRSLLYTVLKQQPSLLAVVLPSRWALLHNSLATPTLGLKPELEPWGLKELKDAFTELIKQDLVRLKLFFLVDGLDEYDGDPEDITELFREISSSSNVKAVVSSRWLKTFAKSFKDCPTLALHACTEDDMKRFVAGTLQENPSFKLHAKSDSHLANQIIHRISNRAEGVFLWAKLAISLTIRGLKAGNSLEAINTNIISIPHQLTKLGGEFQALDETWEDLEFGNLYEHLWEEIPEDARSGASQILQIMAAMRTVRKGSQDEDDDTEPLTLIALALADGDIQEAVGAEVGPWELYDIQRRSDSMAKRLRLELSGFIEIQISDDQDSAPINPGSRLRYSHRSTREYVDSILESKLVGYTSRSAFNPYLSLIKSYVQHLKILDPIRSRKLDVLWFFVTTSLLCAHYFESKNPVTESYTDLLKALDQTMEKYHENNLKDEDGNWLERKFVLKTKVKGDDAWGARGDAKLHWSNFHPIHDQPREWKNSFQSLVVQFGLSKFLDKSLTSSHDVLKSKKGRPLLDYAMIPLPSMEHELITQNVIKVLLDHGANPNERFGKYSCWQNALIWQYEHFNASKKKSLTGSSKAQDLAETRLKIFQLLIEHKADIDVRAKVGGDKIFLQMVVGECFSLCDPDHVEELKKMIALRMGKSSNFPIRKFAF